MALGQANVARNSLFLAQYRADNVKVAVAAFEKSMALSQANLARNSFFLALTHWRLGNHEQARRWYDRAVQWMDKSKPEDKELLRFRAEARSEEHTSELQ